MALENFVGQLKEYADQRRSRLTYEEVACTGQDHTRTFTIRAVLDGQSYPEGVGGNKKEAKRKAAENALIVLKGDHTNTSGDEKNSGTANQANQDLNQPVPDAGNKRKSLVPTNFIGLIDDHCKKAGCVFSFIEEKRCGPAHDPQFFYKVKIKDRVYPVGEGKTIKDAKHHAAQLAWEALQEQSDWDSKEASKSALSVEGAAAKLSTPPSMQDSGCANTSKPVTPADSDAFTNSSKPLKEQEQIPIVKPKIKIAANFKIALKDSKEIIMPDFKRNNAENIEQASSQSGDSRFTSEFDSVQRLGKGAFGHVFKARHKLLEKDFAIKVVGCKEKALREAAALSDLQHPNIVRYYTCWLEDSDYLWESSSGSCSTSQSSSEYSGKYLYIQMEMCAVRTLRVWIDEKNVQNLKKSLRDSKRRTESLTFALQMVSGVDYIHSKMLFHRDLKPANIMFGQDGEVKIGDFGLVATESYDTDNLVERSEYKGTPSYMAPEQKSKTTYDRKVDIFALGLIYFELLWNLSTGHERVVIWEDARNQKLPQVFCQHFGQESLFIISMLRVKPEDRPEASEVKTSLEKYRNASEAHEQRTY